MSQGLKELLSKYDWRIGNAEGIDAHSAEIDAIVAEPQEQDPELLYRLGTYLQHHKKDSLRAITVLEVAQYAFRHSYANNKCYEVGNNLAYAIVDALVRGKITDTGLGHIGRAAELVAETERNCKDPEIFSFAKRILGQSCFYISKGTRDPQIKEQFLEKGIAQCLAGVEKLNLKDTRQLSEAARTHNRNGVELLHYLRNKKSNIAEDKLIIARAATQALTAEQLWYTLPATECIEYRGRTNFTLGEIFIEKSKLDDGNRDHMETARGYLAKAVAQFSKAGNISVMTEARNMELQLAGQLNLMPVTRKLG